MRLMCCKLWLNLLLKNKSVTFLEVFGLVGFMITNFIFGIADIFRIIFLNKDFIQLFGIIKKYPQNFS